MTRYRAWRLFEEGMFWAGIVLVTLGLVFDDVEAILTGIAIFVLQIHQRQERQRRKQQEWNHSCTTVLRALIQTLHPGAGVKAKPRD